ncbi:DNA phosphorothioation system sulfurtransferase DndC, partial [Streptomyces caeruleatus]
MIETLIELAPDERRRRVHVVSNDTLVEAPVVADHVDRVRIRVRAGVAALRLPLEVVKTTPKLEQSFWVNLIGRGYP